MTEPLIALSELPENKKNLENLRSLADKLQQKGIRSGLLAAGTPVVESMRRLAPDDPSTPGNRIASAITKGFAKTGQKVSTGEGMQYLRLDAGEYAYIIGPNKVSRDPETGKKSHVRHIARFTDQGTGEHDIYARRGKLSFGGRVYTGKVKHLGSRGTRWVSRSLSAASSQIESAFYTGLEKWLLKNGY